VCESSLLGQKESKVFTVINGLARIIEWGILYDPGFVYDWMSCFLTGAGMFQ
jgi:hypothetical protein